ncbi:uncharacterized protein BX663DRAFT_493874 [Cokeromyces recurvatus]|uniref:uncharacterized protein n=1 Tax=Cokeromyces recurvatus TaxID=90255 RepID=UPI0022203EBD|nr:uncharacterized protein BX663DRAFT_493874 [Cokeromyces recurvatus]KAI7908344.1 hypothetical protein BX663DRAFT_493874 [Cokeromyces recurvatus]
MVKPNGIASNHHNCSPHQHKGTYMLHSSVIDCNKPEEISLDVQNSYIQQNLPVRRQSLVVYHDKLRSEKHSSQHSTSSSFQDVEEENLNSPHQKYSSLIFNSTAIEKYNKISASKSLNSIYSQQKLYYGNRQIPNPPLSIQTATLPDFDDNNNHLKSSSISSSISSICSSHSSHSNNNHNSPNELVTMEEENYYQKQSIPKFIGLLRPSKSDMSGLNNNNNNNNNNKKGQHIIMNDDTNTTVFSSSLSQTWSDMSQPLSKLRNVFCRNSSNQIPSTKSKRRLSQKMGNESEKKKRSPLILDSSSGRRNKTKKTKSDSRVYTALLSHVSRMFLKKMHISTIAFKDGIHYYDVFHGVEAVDCITRILKANDRSLALLIGRSLESQGLFHHVNYDCHLKDTKNELYQFQYIQPEEDTSSTCNSSKPSIHLQCHSSSPATSPISNKLIPLRKSYKKQVPLICETVPINGVFSMLTDCYSPTCTKNTPCYSISCPRMMTQKQKSFQRPLSSHLFRTEQEKQLRSLWRHSVPINIVMSTDDIEKKRQECIYELIYTEEDFAKDLQYIREFWIQPLQKNDIIPTEKRMEFIKDVFWNILDIEHISTTLSRELNMRQDKHSVIPCISDIMLRHVENFSPFVIYGAHQIFGKYKYELEKKQNPRFQQFVQKVERCPESRRLELNAYLTKPTSRLGRYNLLLTAIHQLTPKDNQDYYDIPKIIQKVTEYLVQLNKQAGLADNAFHLEQISSRIMITKGIELNLHDPERKLLMRGKMKRLSLYNVKNNNAVTTSPIIENRSSMDIQLFLFDHYLVFCKIKKQDGLEYYKIYQKPISMKTLFATIPNLG